MRYVSCSVIVHVQRECVSLAVLPHEPPPGVYGGGQRDTRVNFEEVIIPFKFWEQAPL